MRITSLKNILAVTLLACATTLMGQNVRKWDFTNWSEETITNLKADAAGWSDDEKGDGTTNVTNGNCMWQVTVGETDLTANGTAIAELVGLKFTNTKDRGLAIAINYPSTSLGTYNGPSYLWLGSKEINYFTIPNVKAGATVKMGVESHKNSAARGVQVKVGATALNDPDGNAVSAPTTYTEQTWLLPAEGVTGETANEDGTYDLIVYNTDGCHLYYIEVTEPASKGEGEGGEEVVSTWKDIKLDLATCPFLGEAPVANTAYKLGVAIAEDGTQTRVEADDASANIVLDGSYHNDHGWGSVTATVKVEGSVKVGIGQCSYGGKNATITDAAGNVVEVKVAKTGCYSRSKSEDQISYGYYVGEATTLTIKTNTYTPYLSVEKAVIDHIVVYYNEAYTTADATYTEFIKLPNAEGETITLPTTTPSAPTGKKFSHWALADGTQLNGGEAAADMAVYPVWEDAAVSIGATEAAVKVADIYKYENCEAKDDQLIDSSHEGSYILFDVLPTESGVYNFTSLIATSLDGTAVTLGYVDADGNYVESTKTDIANSKSWTDGKDYTWNFTLTAGTLYTFKMLCHTSQTYCVNVFDCRIAKSTEEVKVEWRDIKIDFTNGKMLTSSETNVTTFGVAIGADGTATRVAADDATANIVVSGGYHSDQHGLGWFSATVKVEGPVKIGMGSCAWGGDVTIKNEAGETVATFNTNNGACWSTADGADKNVIYGYYNGEATTLTISGGSYTPYFSVEKVEEVMTEATVTYSLGDVVCEGSVVPAAVKVVVGTDKVTVPANFTLYVEGKTLTGWTDGTTTYAIGAEIEPTADMTLTPVFTDNAVSLADRKDAVTVKWDFRRDNGAPIVGWEGKTGLIWVTQAVVNGETIDVKLDFSTSPGKFNNSGNTDCIQVNNGTTFTIPSCKGTVVSMECHGSFSISTTTIDGQSDYTAGSNVSYTVANEAETIDIVIGDGSYYKYIQAVLPFVEKSYAGTVFENAEACITWPFNNATDYATAYTSTPGGAFAVISANIGDIEVTGTGTGQAVDENGNKVVFVKLKPSGSTQAVEWSVTPAKGLTFTPTKVTGYIQRFGTDAENGVTVTAMLADGTSITLGNYTAPRNNKSQADDKFGASANYTNQFVVELTEEQQAALTSADGFTLSATVGVGAGKEGGFSDIRIYGTVNGTVADVAKYAVAIAGNIEEAGSVSIYPVSAKYDEGTEVTLTAVEDFGYNFVNWTNAAGEEVSTDSKFVWTVSADETLTANFVQVNTYELAMAINGGANDYMISYNPAPTIVDGKQMYEEGAEVTLIAASNEILDFNSWSNGETSSEIKVVMNENISLAADYSADDYVVGWDFYRAGGNGRVADFYSTSDNEATQLVLINEAGTTQGWLDKSTMAANGYESMKGAAVNWKPLGEYYYQTKLNAKDFTNLQVKSQLLCNYNAYSRISLDWSLDGETWTSAGEVTLETVKVIYDLNVTLPAEADHAETLYLRWKPDLASAVVGTEALANDGTAISNIFVLADAAIYDDGVAPKLLSTVPAEGATNASANGRVVLNFDEKVKLNEGAKATLNGEELTLAVSGKTVTAEYKGLTYSTNYSFELTANAVSDLAGNTLADAIKIDFATMTKPTVTKALYDFIVPDDGNFKEALEAAAARADKGKRYRIFVKQGAHIIPANAENMVTGSDGKSYPDPKTYFNTPNVSIIGEGLDNTSVANTMPNDLAANPDAGKGGQANPLEGIRTSGVLYLQGNATNTYFEDITLKTNTPDATGRNVVLVDGGNKTICKDVCLWAYQDTYVSDRGQSLYYFEGGVIRGRTDFICGSGDVFFNAVDIVMCEKGGYVVAPRDNVKYGYVFKDCTLKGETDDVNGNYFLGRSWTEAGETYYIDCVMEAIPNAGGWTNMAAGGWTRCAEYNSTTASGTVVDLSGRVTELGGNPTNPILTAEEAAEIGNMANMFGDWDPKAATEQASAPTNVKIENSVITWDNNEYVLLWAICKDGKVVDFTTEPTYTVDDATATYSVRAANEMGGLGEASIAQDPTSIEGLVAGQEVVNVAIYTTSGVQVGELQQGINIVRTTYANGVVKTVKVVVK